MFHPPSIFVGPALRARPHPQVLRLVHHLGCRSLGVGRRRGRADRHPLRHERFRGRAARPACCQLGAHARVVAGERGRRRPRVDRRPDWDAVCGAASVTAVPGVRRRGARTLEFQALAVHHAGHAAGRYCAASTRQRRGREVSDIAKVRCVEGTSCKDLVPAASNHVLIVGGCHRPPTPGRDTRGDALTTADSRRWIAADGTPTPSAARAAPSPVHLRRRGAGLRMATLLLANIADVRATGRRIGQGATWACVSVMR
jgi:hypothetical protein